MNHIDKFQKFNESSKKDLNKVDIPILDMVIDNDGNLYSGKGGFPSNGLPMKGSVEKNRRTKSSNLETRSIVGSNGKLYPAGIDKNGNLVAVQFDRQGNALTLPIKVDKEGKEEIDENQPKVKIEYSRVFKEIYSKFIIRNHAGTVWNQSIDYIDIVPIVPTGWVNAKVDMEIIKRVKRYSKNLGEGTGHESFISRLSNLQRMSEGLLKRQRKAETIQREMAVVILLHYINEIKDFFTPSSSGFLFESFIAGLIPNSKVSDDNTAADIISFSDGKKAKYQIKLLTNNSEYCPVNHENKLGSSVKMTEAGSKPLDYYIICLKYPTKIDIHILDGKKSRSKNYYVNFTTPGGTSKKDADGKGKESAGPQFAINKIKDLTEPEFKFSLELINIEEKIEVLSSDLKKYLGIIYGELSKFQYNIETILTGVDEMGDVIDGPKFIQHDLDAQTNLRLMKYHLNGLVSITRPKNQNNKL